MEFNLVPTFFNKAIPSRGIPQLDTLRFLAVTLVVSHHAFLKGNFFFQWLHDHAYVGVDIFFTLSGFIITVGLMKEYQRQQTIDFKSFIIKRIFRLWPGFYAGLIFSTILVYIMGRSNPDIMSSLSTKAWRYYLHFGNYSYVYTGRLHTLFSHFWSLAVEEHFYLTWPAIFLFISRSPKMKWVVFPLLLIVPYFLRVLYKSNGAVDYVNTFSTETRFDALAFGCLLAFVLPKLSDKNINLKQSSIFLISSLIMGAGLAFKFNTESFWISEAGYTLRSLGTVGYLIFLINIKGENIFTKILMSPLLARLGVLSYGVYLFHFITNTFYFKVMASLKNEPSQWMNFIVLNAIPYIPAFLFYSLIETKFMKIRDRFLSKSKKSLSEHRAHHA